MLTVDSKDQAAQDLVRDKASGRGLLYPDTFSEERLTFLPPAASVLLILFSRNHNVGYHVFIWIVQRMIFSDQYIAEKILKINERKTWSDPPPAGPVARAAQDEQIFQTARLVKSVFLCTFNETLANSSPVVAGTS
jgi:linoleate 10R-lipoxygenase